MKNEGTMKNKDDLIKMLVRKKGLENAPSDFTEKLMAQIERSEEPSNDRIFTKMQWGVIIFGMAAAITVVIFLDIPIFRNIFTADRLSSIQFGSLHDQVLGWVSNTFTSIQIPPLAIIVLAAIFLLLGIERVVRYRNSQASLL
jgi:hypothetical protein